MLQHKALRLHQPTAPVSLSIDLIDTPALQPGEVRVRMLAAALNHRDVWQREGLYPGLQYPGIPGSDGVGVVEAVSDEDTAAWEGTEVIINPNIGWGTSQGAQLADYNIRGIPSAGTFQEYLNLPLDRIAPKPAHLTVEQAAALPLAGLTAFRAATHHGQIKAGQKVLVTGIGGGVAQFAAQFAKALGAEVYATSGEDDKLNRAIREHNLAGGANYRTEGWAQKLKQMSGGFDVILDSAGGPMMNNLIEICRPAGRIVFWGATVGNVPELNLRRIFWNQITLQGSTMGSDEDFAAMVHFVDQHRIVPSVSSVRPFSEIVSAYDEMKAAHQFGKLVVKF